MIKPMLAIPMDKAVINDWSEWALEQKFDGWRVIVLVERGEVTAWTRPRRKSNGNKEQDYVQLPDLQPGKLPAHLASELKRIADGVYDGELLGGRTSTDVGRRDLQKTLRLVIFDVLRTAAGRDMTKETYDTRRAYLALCDLDGKKHVALAASIALSAQADVLTALQAIWDAGGEGAMLKRRASTYQPGKRSKDLVKLKKLFTAVCVVIGFEATRGKVLSRGAFASVILRDDAGNNTTVKTKDDAELAKFQREWDDAMAKRGVSLKGTLEEIAERAATFHPAIGRKLRIEYQERAANGGYRHPRWDRWEEE